MCLCALFVVLTLGIGILIAWLPLGVITIWFIYRIVRGWLALNERRAMYARHDVLAQPRNELFSAADEDISDLLLVALPVDAAGVQAGIRLELEGVLTWRRHLGLVERRATRWMPKAVSNV